MNLYSYDGTIVTFVKITCVAFLLSLGLAAQDQRQVAVEDHRPLVAALSVLESETGIPIDYEDLPYVNGDDVEDVSTPQQRIEVPGFRLLVPRKGRIMMEFNADGARSDPSAAIYQMLASYEHEGLPGEFRLLRRSGGSLSVVPTKIRDSSGKVVSVESPLDVIVSLPTASRSVFETFAALLAEISQTSGVTVDPGAIPFLRDSQMSFGVSREPGRDALARLIKTISSSPVSYRLLYDPALKSFMFNLSPVRASPPSNDETEPPLTKDGPNPFFNQTVSGQ